MNKFGGSIARSNNTIRVGIYRDVECPQLDINNAVQAVDSLHRKFGNIAIAESHRLVQLTEDSNYGITANSVNWLESNNHLNFVFTNRQILDGPKNIPEKQYGTVGMSIHRPYRKPFVVIDTLHAPHLLDVVVQHEAAHLVKVKDRGTYYDNACHCNHPHCLMQPVAQKQINDFCDECSGQLDERLHKLSRLDIPGSEHFRRALRYIAKDKTKTVKPIDQSLEHSWF